MKRVCHAHKTNGDPCKAPAMKGQQVCRVHGGMAPQTRRKALERLLEAADPAAAELVRISTRGKSERDRIAAIKDLLDRAGVGEERTPEVRLVIEWPD